jgi:prepilin-type N-terminal cleavage/methylation domain-containing protein
MAGGADRERIVSGSRASARAGFTLMELLLTMIVLGILGGIAAPTLRGATYRADASKIAADMTTVRTAVFEYREVASRLPSTAAWGTIPPDLAPHFSNVQFVYKNVDYRLVTTESQGRVDFIVRYPSGSPIGAALYRFRRPGSDSGSVIWSDTQSRWRLLEQNQ